MTTLLRTTLVVAMKDWRLFWADRRAALLAFVVPMLLACAFGAIFERPLGESPRLPAIIVCNSTDAAASAFAQRLKLSPRIDASDCSRDDIEQRVADRRPGVAIIVQGARDCRIVHHPLCGSERAWAEGVITEAAVQSLADATGLNLPLKSPVNIASAPVADLSRFNSYSHSFSGMTLQYLLFWGMESGLLFLRERQRGAWQRLRTTPAPFTVILLGKALATAVIGLLIIGVTFAVGRMAFGVHIEGSLIGFALLAFALGTLAAAGGLLVAALGATETRARSISVLAILAVSMIGGLWLPAFLLPDWLRDAGLGLPTTWAMQGLAAVTWQGRSLAATLPAIAAVLAFAVAFLGVATWRLRAQDARRRLGRSA
jgi:ABC-2 type transport system permease protein